MAEQSDALQALGRAGRRVVYHLLQAAIEGLKAIEAVIEEVGSIGEQNDDEQTTRTRIEVE
jgi:hypothetical protein